MSARPTIHSAKIDSATVRTDAAPEQKLAACHKTGALSVLNTERRDAARHEVSVNAIKRDHHEPNNTLLHVIGIVLAAGGMTFAHLHEEGESVKTISVQDIKEKLDGKDATMTVVEVTLDPGQSGVPHRHPGPGFVYVLEGEYELGIDDQPTRMYKAGETFYEPTGCLHRVSRNPAATGRTRLIAVVLHPRDAKEIAIPEERKE